MSEYFSLSTDFEFGEELNGNLPFKCFVAYPDKNRKKIDIPESVFEDAFSTAVGIPVVAHFFSDGQISGHEGDIVKLGFDLRKAGKTYAYGVTRYDKEPYWEEREDGRKWVCMEGYVFTKRFPESKAILNSTQSMEVSLSFSDLESEYKVVDKMEFLALCALNPKGVTETFEDSKFVQFSTSDIYDDSDIQEYYKHMKELFAEDEDGNVKPSDKIKKRGRPKKVKEVVNDEETHVDIAKDANKETEGKFVIDEKEEDVKVDEAEKVEDTKTEDFSMTMNTHRDCLEANFKDIAGNDWYYVQDFDEQYVYIRREGTLYRYAYDMATHAIDANSQKCVVTVTQYLVEGEEPVVEEMSMDETDKVEMALEEPELDSEKKQEEADDKAEEKEGEEDFGCGTKMTYSEEEFTAMKEELMALKKEKKVLEFNSILEKEEYSLFSDDEKDSLKSDVEMSIEAFAEKVDALAYRKSKAKEAVDGKEKKVFSIGIPKTDDVVIEKIDDKPKSALEAVKNYTSR